MSLAAMVVDGNRLALARLLTQIENNTPLGKETLNELYPRTGQAHIVGVTGSPGTGKSSLVNYIARTYRKPQEGVPSRSVAIVAVDPSSPFTGGAILGDRVRMRDLAGDPGVFIRSMASRGSLGGIATATSGVVQVLDAAGYQTILIETVGAGQAEVEIARLAHTTLVVEAPGMGDDIQAIKAGIMEIADILVINKADRPGVENTERALRSMLQLAHPVPHVFHNLTVYKPGHEIAEVQDPAFGDDSSERPDDVEEWITPILCTVATKGTGVLELTNKIGEHYQYLKRTGALQRRERARLQSELNMVIRETLISRWQRTITEGSYNQILQRLVERNLSPWQAADELLNGV